MVVSRSAESNEWIVTSSVHLTFWKKFLSHDRRLEGLNSTSISTNPVVSFNPLDAPLSYGSLCLLRK